MMNTPPRIICSRHRLGGQTLNNLGDHAALKICSTASQRKYGKPKQTKSIVYTSFERASTHALHATN